MSLSMHAASAPIQIRMLGNLASWLERAQAHAETKKFESTNYLALRLAPDMLPFVSQVRIASDIARLTMSRLTGAEFPRHADDETTLPALGERVAKSIAFLKSFDAVQFEGTASKAIVLPQRVGEPLHFTGESFLQRWALPNFFFHVTTAYALLRHAGVDLGKADYLGTFASHNE